MILKPNENAWRWKGLPSIRKQWVGNGEAVLSLVCLVSLFLFCSPPGHLTRESQIPWMLFVILGLGIGLSVGGMRFGSLPGYLIGIFIAGDSAADPGLTLFSPVYQFRLS